MDLLGHMGEVDSLWSSAWGVMPSSSARERLERPRSESSSMTSSDDFTAVSSSFAFAARTVIF